MSTNAVRRQEMRHQPGPHFLDSLPRRKYWSSMLLPKEGVKKCAYYMGYEAGLKEAQAVLTKRISEIEPQWTLKRTKEDVVRKYETWPTPV